MKGFSEPDLQGESFTTTDNYPDMKEWNDQIGSVQVVSGTWEFFSDDNYGGESMRLAPGDYRQLGESWQFQISSFMCSEPGAGGAGGAPGGPPPGAGPGGPGGPGQMRQ